MILKLSQNDFVVKKKVRYELLMKSELLSIIDIFFIVYRKIVLRQNVL